MKRSKLDMKQRYEYESKWFVEGVIDGYGWKYREQEKDNDIDGEIEIFSGTGQTTAKIVKVQLKATKKLNIEGESVIFDCPVKFLNFCDVCDIPIIIVVYGVEDKKAYWLWTQKYIFQTLDIENPAWRNNTSKVRIKLPLNNEVENKEGFYKDIELIGNEGVNDIQQQRKQNTSDYYYTILEEKDSSTSQKRRLSAKVYIERSFATSKDSMVELIKKINERIISNNYSRNILKGDPDSRKADYVWLYLYDDLIQFEHGLPFCRTEWKNSQNKDDFILLQKFDDFLANDCIRIKWESNYRPLQEYFITNSISKKKYLEKIKEYILFVQQELTTTYNYFMKENKKEFYSYIKQNKGISREKFICFGDIERPPYDCKNLHLVILDSLANLDNLFLSVDPESRNESYLFMQYISKFPKELAILEYEINKVI
ncbi:DUF4365 domain-containing protein [Bacillus wiedmannii]|uniref:DUF4365 domain-containing protein n=1 Tax=Bacillus wiedmannii TaxID=1890302 RepID=UPI0033935D04